jgi:hypothetical protein
LAKHKEVVVYCGSAKPKWETFHRLNPEGSWDKPNALFSRRKKTYWNIENDRVTPFDYENLDTQIQKQIRDCRRAVSASNYQRLKIWSYGALAKDSTGRTLAWLLNTYSESLCSDPRDKVSALLSLAKDCQHGRALQADHSKGAATLFWDVMNYCKPANAISFGRMLQRSLSVTRVAFDAAIPYNFRRNFYHPQQ